MNYIGLGASEQLDEDVCFGYYASGEDIMYRTLS